LPDVNTRGARRERDVYAIIDEDGYVVFWAQRDGILGYLEELFHYLRLYISVLGLALGSTRTSPVSRFFSRTWTTVTPPWIACIFHGEDNKGQGEQPTSSTELE
jgi:hypothetical protein